MLAWCGKLEDIDGFLDAPHSMKAQAKAGRLGKNGFPSLKGISIYDLRRRIAAFRRMDLETLLLAEVQARLARLLDGYPFSLSQMDIHGVFRVRKNPTPGKTLGHARELWYPPAHAVKELGRMNDVGQARLYCSSAPHTAMFEARAEPGDTVTLVWAKARPKFARMNVAFLGASKSIDPYIQQSRNEALLTAQKRQELGPSNYLKFVELDRVLTNLMTEAVTDNWRYKPTVALGTMLLDEAKVEAVQFPSVSTSLEGVNMVMTPETADNLFVPDEAWEFQCLSMYEQPTWEKPLLGMVPVRRSGLITPDGQIFWRQPGDGVSNGEWAEWAGIQHELVAPEDMPKPVASSMPS